MAINNFIGEYQIKDTSVCDKLITYFKNNISRASKGGFMINGELEVDETNKESVDLGIDNLNDIDYYFKSFNGDMLTVSIYNIINLVVDIKTGTVNDLILIIHLIIGI